jgi:hypothetical protein
MGIQHMQVIRLFNNMFKSKERYGDDTIVDRLHSLM